MKPAINRKFSKKRTYIFYGFIILFFAVVVGVPAFYQEKPIVTEEYNGLTLEVYEAYFTEDEDDGKLIANIPVELTNASDHAFTVHVDAENVDVDDSEVAGEIDRGTTNKGTVTFNYDTRDRNDVKSINPTVRIYDMKTEQEEYYTLDLTP